jgi:hypothetical protein
MSRRFVPLLVAVLAVGLAWADDPPPDPGDAPVRLKKKAKPGQPDKADPAKPPAGEDKEKKPKEPAKEEDPRGQPEPDQPQEDEKEVLQRVGKNMRSVEERLGNKELNEGTHQLQEDILKDLESLIRLSQQQQDQGGGSADPSSSPDMASKQKQGGSQSERKQQARAKRNQRNQMAKNRPSGGQSQGRQGEQSQDQMANNSGNEGGGGGKSPTGPDRNADLYKDIWGHLPEALRAEMNAYSNPQPFMNKYDELIKKYYTTIAEKGRRKGD